MSGKLVFFDVDGTLWDEKRVIPQSTCEAFKKLRQNGHRTFICSGRAKGNICMPSLLELKFDGIIAACGAYAEVDGQIIYNRLVEREVVIRTVEAIRKYNLPSVLEGPVKHWVSDWGFEEDDYVHNLFEVMGDKAIVLKGCPSDIEMNKFAADVLVMTDYAKLKEELSDYYRFIEHGLTPDLYINRNDADDPRRIRGVIEAVPRDVDKGNGIRRVCEYLGVDLRDTYAFGDSVNDLEMFSAVGHSICMGNGSEKAKAAAEWVTESLHENGLYNALEKYGLL